MVQEGPAEQDSTHHNLLVKMASQQNQIQDLNKKVSKCPTHAHNCANDYHCDDLCLCHL